MYAHTDDCKIIANTRPHFIQLQLLNMNLPN